ncbi:MAG: hypothetical protein Q6373_009720 [Candidatus Sigynarchaeota archaeon]
MATNPAKFALKDIDPKILAQKIVGMLVIQGFIFWIFTIIDPGFTDSLMMYFWFVAIGSVVVISWVHIHNNLEEARKKKAGVLGQTDYAGD